ncbi:hypothetical protein N8G13_01980 [Mycoplasma zalophi]|uniref:hypothetical protein n=1 Tax=Mycoplasma zalophi TaxID=191287 RepID=UPI0021C5925C|nr:hypothetical protein [Mycoplasma zalophi]MCU4117223.1 hypothetical protein [Mycoplasma zalophi]
MKSKFLKTLLISGILIPSAILTISCSTNTANTKEIKEDNKQEETNKPATITKEIKEFIEQIELAIKNSNEFSSEQKEELNKFLNEYKNNPDENAKQLLEQKTINFILQNFSQTRQIFLLASILVRFANIKKDPEFFARLQNVTKNFDSLQSIISIIKEPKLEISEEDAKTFNNLYKTVLEEIQLNQYILNDSTINQLVFKQNPNFSLFTLTEKEIKDIQESAIFNLEDNNLNFEVSQIVAKSDNTIKNQLSLNINLERDLEISKIKDNILVYSEFKTIDDEFIEDKNDNIQLSHFYNQEFFNNKFLMYLSINATILTTQDKLFTIYEVPFSIENNQIIKKTRYIFDSYNLKDLQGIESDKVLRALKGIYLEFSKDTNIDSIIE